MRIEPKEKIVDLLIKLENAVNNESEDLLVKDYKLPSLQLWTNYQVYLHNVLITFETKTPEEYKILEQIVTFLELDCFHINANESFYENRIELLDYINRIKEKLNMNVLSNK